MFFFENRAYSQEENVFSLRFFQIWAKNTQPVLL